MKLSVEKTNDVDVLILEGRLDAASAKNVKSEVNALTKDNRIKMVMDMGEISFMDSSGLGSLVASLRSVNKLGGDIKIAALQDPVRVIFELTRLHRIFEIFDDKESAVESFQ